MSRMAQGRHCQDRICIRAASSPEWAVDTSASRCMDARVSMKKHSKVKKMQFS
ncbi:Hypothetical protein GbCGDNIH9_7288 [Granulibacter bethesdensis]|uniref:Uncharacterized protein n=1 Tax=Granulibacter bethesdensis TaxID=364410 RepID=A0AAC9P929_9PROT|nr:Hypothetical protein GbCGDNIH9_7288 [Granulibacter bethesdensis]APH62713.1 Hypothetical protein GbCGDNIH8_7288 [Granulibacter bethesdensis]